MPTFPLGKGASISLNSVDYSASIYGEDWDVSVEALDNTTHSTSYHKSNQPGLIESGFKAKFYYVQSEYSALRTLLVNRTTFAAIYGPEGSGTGKEKITVADGFLTSVSRPVTVDGITSYDIEYAVGATAPAYSVY